MDKSNIVLRKRILPALRLTITTNGVVYTGDTNSFRFPRDTKYVTGFRIDSSYPERMKFAGKFSLSLGNSQVFDMGVLAALVSSSYNLPMAERMYNLVPHSGTPCGYDASNESITFSYTDNEDPAYTPAPFASYDVLLTFEVSY